MQVTRTLPTRTRRMVGAWCFLDAYGPAPAQMSVAPHPHTGLQTVSWLLAGRIRHQDSLGNDIVVAPGQLNLMTAGAAISHAETSVDASAALHGVQLWVALPEADRHRPPDFAHHGDLPVFTDGPLTATVIMGELAGRSSPARTFSPLVGAELTLAPGQTAIPLDPHFEYAALLLDGQPTVAGVTPAPGTLLYLGTGRTELTLAAPGPARLLLLGGEPFAEQLLMWWNFVARSHDEIVDQREAWEHTDRFGTVPGWDGVRLPAPALPGVRLRPRGRIG